MSNILKGIITALITPFSDNDRLDEEGLRVLLKRQVEAKVHGVAVVAGSGEYVNLSEAERSRILQISVNEISGRIPVIAGILEPNTRDARTWANKAARLGADALLVLTPFYNRPSNQGIISHFKAVAEITDLPVIIYNNPGRTGINLSLGDYMKLAEIPKMVGIKECNRDLGIIARTIDALGSEWSILSGEDDLLYPSLELGAQGGILTSSNVMPSRWVEMYNSFVNGDHETPKSIHYDILPFFSAIYSYNHPALVKKALTILNLPAGATRLPLDNPTHEEEEKLKELLS